jgi:serine protease Do
MRLYHYLLIGVLAGTVGLAGAVWQAGTAAENPNRDDAAAVSQAKGLSRAFRSAAEKVLPTVVKIQTTVKPRTVSSLPGGRGPDNPFRGTPFEDFFNDDRMPGYRFEMPRQFPRRQGVGSGVIINSKGIILTNNHVVQGADEITVELADGRKFKAVDIRTDELSDLAVVRIEAEGSLPAARLGNSNDAGIGDWVLAIGSPFELESTVSAGIISGKGRQLPSGKRTEFLQTDASINPGNSGGPLVNLDGEVIGINTAIASNNGAFQGVGFAIPVNLAKWVTPQLLKSGKVRRAYLGVEMDELEPKVAAKLGVPRGQGVLVKEVVPESPAAKAGLEPGDVIVAFAGRQIRGFRELQEVVERSPIGSKQKIDVVRAGEPRALQVTVTSLPDNLPLALRRGGEGGARDSDGYQSESLGLEVGELDEQVAERLGHEGSSGVLITDVDPDGLAASAGIRPGSLILQVGKKKVTSVAEFKAALKGEGLEEGILLVLQTESGKKWLVLQSS